LSDNLPFEDDKNAEQASSSGESVKGPAEGEQPQVQGDDTTCADCVSIQVRLFGKVDPNLIVTANDKLLYRVRDERGRGLYVQPGQTGSPTLAGGAAEQTVLNQSRFGLLERDTIVPDSWYLTDSYTLVLNLSKATAGVDRFPIIRFANPSSKGGELLELTKHANDVRVGEWQFVQPGKLPATAFLPLFSKLYGRGPISVYVESAKSDGTHSYPETIRIVSRRYLNGSRVWLQDAAQVVLEAEITGQPAGYVAAPAKPVYYPRAQKIVKGSSAAAEHSPPIRLAPNWALRCRQDRGELVCTMPLTWMQMVCNQSNSGNEIRNLADAIVPEDKVNLGNLLGCFDHLKVWVDQPPFRGREGLWGDADLTPNHADLTPNHGDDFTFDLIPYSHYYLADFDPDATWQAELCIRNMKSAQHYCVCDTAGQNCLAATADTPRRGSMTCIGETSLTFAAPYQQLAALASPEALGLYRPNSYGRCDPRESPGASPLLTLPPLRPDLLPSKLDVIQTGDLAFIQGRRLGGVVAVYLQKGEDARKTIPKESLTRSARQVSFAIPPKLTGTYSVSLGVQSRQKNPEIVPAYGKDNKPLTLTFGTAEKPTTTTPSEPSLKLKAVQKSPGADVTITVTASTGKPDTQFTDTVSFKVAEEDVKLADHTFKEEEKGQYSFTTQFKKAGKKTITATSGKLSGKAVVTVKEAPAKPPTDQPKPDAKTGSPTPATGSETQKPPANAAPAKKP
jgi:hypothetical protein